MEVRLICSFLYLFYLTTLFCRVGRLCWLLGSDGALCVFCCRSRRLYVVCGVCVCAWAYPYLLPSILRGFQVPVSKYHSRFIQHPPSHCRPSSLSPLPPSSAMCVCVCAAMGATRMSARRHHHMRAAACQLSARPETLCERFWC